MDWGANQALVLPPSAKETFMDEILLFVVRSMKRTREESKWPNDDHGFSCHWGAVSPIGRYEHPGC